MRAFASDTALTLRHPESTRPWQYVLDPICGYLLLAERLAAGDKAAAGAWNFGPGESGSAPVRAVAEGLAECWNEDPGLDATARWQAAEDETGPYEARALGVDSAKARKYLNWRPRMTLHEGFAATVAWHKAQLRGEDMATASESALDYYLEG